MLFRRLIFLEFTKYVFRAVLNRIVFSKVQYLDCNAPRNRDGIQNAHQRAAEVIICLLSKDFNALFGYELVTVDYINEMVNIVCNGEIVPCCWCDWAD
jgi:hypothetical protein